MGGDWENRRVDAMRVTFYCKRHMRACCGRVEIERVGVSRCVSGDFLPRATHEGVLRASRNWEIWCVNACRLSLGGMPRVAHVPHICRVTASNVSHTPDPSTPIPQPRSLRPYVLRIYRDTPHPPNVARVTRWATRVAPRLPCFPPT